MDYRTEERTNKLITSIDQYIRKNEIDSVTKGDLIKALEDLKKSIFKVCEVPENRLLAVKLNTYTYDPSYATNKKGKYVESFKGSYVNLNDNPFTINYHFNACRLINNDIYNDSDAVGYSDGNYFHLLGYSLENDSVFVSSVCVNLEAIKSIAYDITDCLDNSIELFFEKTKKTLKF